MLLLLISTLFFNTLSLSHGATATVQLVDMTYTFNDAMPIFPTQTKFKLNVILNGTTDKGYWVQLEDYSSAIHVGTHMDAPCHFALGKWCVDEISLETLIAPAAVVDIINKAAANPDALVETDDLRKWEEITGKNLNGTIVVMKTGWGSKWADKNAFLGTTDNNMKNLHFPGMSPEAAQWLVDNRKIYGVGTECLSLDNGQSDNFMSHRILLGDNIFGLENVANVEKIPIDGATLHVMPMKIGNGSGAPVRIIASYPKATPQPNGDCH